MSSKDEDLLNMANSFVPRQFAGKQTKPKAKAKAKAKAKSKAKHTKDAPAKKIHQKKDKVTKKVSSKKPAAQASADAHPDPSQCPEYKVIVPPSKDDGYKNLYTSRHYNKAKDLALRFGLSLEQANAKGRVAAAAARELWDYHHPN